MIGVAAFAIAFTAETQADFKGPEVWDGVYTQNVSTDGRYVMAQDIVGNTYLMDMATGQTEMYAEMYSGDGNCLADNGTIVGEDANKALGVIMIGGKVYTPASLQPYPLSSLSAITPDGTRAVGYVMNPGAGPVYVPVMIEINPDGSSTEAILLPYPKKDSSGRTPQGVICHVISDDGKTVGGLVIDDSGDHSLPVAFRQNDSGEWEYMQPDFTGYDEIPDFNGSMAINGEGTKIACPQIAGSLATMTFSFIPWIYDIETGDFHPLDSTTDLLPAQILPSGDIIAVTSPASDIPWNSYIYIQEKGEFEPFGTFVEENIPAYYGWMEDHLTIAGTDEIQSGKVAVSRDMTTIACGLPLNEYDTNSYIFYDPDGEYTGDSGVESMEEEKPEADSYYNLNGMPVNRPGKGIYIRNGKKIIF